MGVWSLDKPAHNSPLGIPPRQHNGVGPGCTWSLAFVNASSGVLLGARFASPTCAVEVPRDKISVFLYSRNTDC